MIVMVSRNTLSARDPDHSASTKPSDTTSMRPPLSTSSRVGAMSSSTVEVVNACDARSSTRSLKSSICATWYCAAK